MDVHLDAAECGCSCAQAVAGIVADGRQIVNRACEESRSYKRWGLYGSYSAYTASLLSVLNVLSMVQLLWRCHSRAGPCRQGSQLRACIQPLLVCEVSVPSSQCPSARTAFEVEDASLHGLFRQPTVLRSTSCSCAGLLERQPS